MLRKLALQQQSVVNLIPKIHKTAAFSSRRNDRDMEDIKKGIEESKKGMKWRPEVDERKGAWYSKLKVFSNPEQTSDFISIMQQPIDITPSSVKKWWHKRGERNERLMQSYIPERHEILGSDLAASHFVVFRGGAVKFLNNPKWIRKDEKDNFDLPNKYHPLYKVEAIKCDRMTLYYEGLENIRRLQNLKFLSFVDVKTFDDWCLDRVSGSQHPVLEVLDLSGTNITYRGLSCLYRFDSLKLLILDDPKCSQEMELTCALLEVDNPKLKIHAAKHIHDI